MSASHFPENDPVDAADPLARAHLALSGLSVGDAFGQRYLMTSKHAHYVRNRLLFHCPWTFTDDTVMAVSIVECLATFGRIDQDALARAFARRYAAEPDRGYGAGAATLLEALASGGDWRQLAPKLFDGQGSMGNGSAMRVGPVGAYFADDLDRVVEQARLSAQVTHTHPDAQAGAIATALAAAFAWRSRNASAADRRSGLFSAVLAQTPDGPTKEGLRKADALPFDTPIHQAVATLGNGSWVTCQDTVPLCLWCAAGHLDSYVEALWTVAGAFGDMDTNCAIVGGIVALAVGPAGIPAQWFAWREPLPKFVM